MFVKDLMTREPVTVGRDTTLKQAAAILAGRGITSVPVLDDSGRLCGILSEADLIRDAFPRDPRSHLIPDAADEHPQVSSVSEVMTEHVISVRDSTDVAEAVELMTTTGVKSLPVLDDRGRLAGVVSRSDLVRARARADDVIEREIDALLVSLGHGDWLVEVSDGSAQIEGPETPRDRAIAEVAAASVAGVLSVKVC